MKAYWPIAFAAVAVVAGTYPIPAQQPAYQFQGFTPGFDDLMTILVQPRHIKLYYAGMAANWELAAAEVRDLRQAMDRIAMAIPNYLGNDVKQATENFLVPGISAMDAAVAAADRGAFDKAYQQVTDGCNACHTYMEHPFIVMKVPSAPTDTAHADQEYAPVP